MAKRRIYFIRDETGWVEWFPTLGAMRERFDEHIADGGEPDTGHQDYENTREGICRLLSITQPEGD